MTSIVIAGYARSPFHFAKKGGLINLRPDDLAAQVLKAWSTSSISTPASWRT